MKERKNGKYRKNFLHLSNRWQLTLILKNDFKKYIIFLFFKLFISLSPTIFLFFLFYRSEISCFFSLFYSNFLSFY